MSQRSLFETVAEKKDHKTSFTLYIDGASRGNPGPSSVGCVIKQGDTVIEEHGYYLGNKTNNQAEYAALLIGLCYAIAHLTAHDHLLIISDSELLVKQLMGRYRVKDPILKILHARAQQLLTGVDHRIMHVLRAHNTHADMLANKALDKKITLPADLVPLVSHA